MALPPPDPLVKDDQCALLSATWIIVSLTLPLAGAAGQILAHGPVENHVCRAQSTGASVGAMNVAELLGGRYQLRGLLGRGGMADVHDGWDLRLSRPVAIKLLHPGLVAKPENRLRFEAEARAAATLTSPHIVMVHDTGEHDGAPFIVMERLPGMSLTDQITKGPLPSEMVRDVLDDVLAGLAVAHAHGILHRDIKPGNILFTASREAKLADFGIAKTAAAAYTMTGQIIGTLAYLSPERLAGKPATPTDDLYAVGVVGFEALAGRRPFTQGDPAALARAILTEAPPPLGALRPDVEPGLAAVVNRAIARDPARRFGNAHEMRAALLGSQPPNPFTAPPPRPATRALSEPAIPPAPTVASWAAMRGPAQKRKLLAVGAVVAVLVLVIVLLATDSSSPAPPTPVTTNAPVPSPTTTMTTPMTTTAIPLPAPPHRPGKKGEGDDD
jgi:serine/threonine protein kinase